jgi:hypothetical protein
MGLLKKIGKIGKKLIKGDLLGAAGSVVGAVIGSKGSKKAAKKSAAAAEAAAAEQRNALARVAQYQQPYLDAGSPAINALNQVNQGDYSAFESSPDYLYARGEALRGVEGSAAARGGLFSGNAGRELARVGSGLASQNLGNYRNALMQQIGIGQSAANNLGNATLGVAGNVGNALIGAGDARASGIVGATNAITGGIEDLAGLAGNALGKKLVKRQPIGGAYAWNYTAPNQQRVS